MVIYVYMVFSFSKMRFLTNQKKLPSGLWPERSFQRFDFFFRAKKETVLKEMKENYAKLAPKSLHAWIASSFGLSLQMTLSSAKMIPASSHWSSQFFIHSPTPHP